MKLNTPDASGVPDISPVNWFNVRPFGKEPLINSHAAVGWPVAVSV